MTKQKIIFITIVSICSLFIYFESCRKKATPLPPPPPCTSTTLPDGYDFEINKGEQFVTDKSLLSQIRISYYDAANKTKQYLQENIGVSDTITINGIIHRMIGGRGFAYVSGDTINGSKTFYVEYPAQLGTVDTLYINYTRYPCYYTFDTTTTINHQQIPKNIYIVPAAPGATVTVPLSVYVINK